METGIFVCIMLIAVAILLVHFEFVGLEKKVDKLEISNYRMEDDIKQINEREVITPSYEDDWFD